MDIYIYNDIYIYINIDPYIYKDINTCRGATDDLRGLALLWRCWIWCCLSLSKVASSEKLWSTVWPSCSWARWAPKMAIQLEWARLKAWLNGFECEVNISSGND